MAVSTGSAKVDITWWSYFGFALLFMLAGYAFDEVVRPMRGVAIPEMILWYIGYGPGFLLLVSLPVALFHLIGKRRGKGINRPKRMSVIGGALLLIFTLASTARHYT